MDRRRFLLTSLVGPLAASLSDAQRPGKIARIGVLANSPGPSRELFRRRLQALGYKEGQNSTARTTSN